MSVKIPNGAMLPVKLAVLPANSLSIVTVAPENTTLPLKFAVFKLASKLIVNTLPIKLPVALTSVTFAVGTSNNVVIFALFAEMFALAVILSLAIMFAPTV